MNKHTLGVVVSFHSFMRAVKSQSSNSFVIRNKLKYDMFLYIFIHGSACENVYMYMYVICKLAICHEGNVLHVSTYTVTLCFFVQVTGCLHTCTCKLRLAG